MWVPSETFAVLLVLALARLVPVTLLVPYLGGRLVPGVAKLALAVALAIVVVPSLSMPASLESISLAELGLLGVKEVVVGLAIGFVGALVFYAAQMAGSLIDTVRGQTLAGALVPSLEERASPTTALVVPLMIVVYLAIDGHHYLIRAVAGSFEAIPLTSWPSVGSGFGAIAWQVVRLTGELFAIALAIGLPVIAAALLVDLALGVLNRAVPEVHGFFLGLPVKALLGILVVLVGLAVITDVLTTDVDRSLDWVRWLVDALAS